MSYKIVNYYLDISINRDFINNRKFYVFRIVTRVFQIALCGCSRYLDHTVQCWYIIMLHSGDVQFHPKRSWENWIFFTWARSINLTAWQFFGHARVPIFQMYSSYTVFYKYFERWVPCRSLFFTVSFHSFAILFWIRYMKLMKRGYFEIKGW